jgi:hypothetical protein
MLIENRPLIFSHGGGRQTIAMGVLAVKGEIEKPSMIIMADTGREATSTWDYHKRYFLPFMETNGMTVHIAPHTLSHYDLYSRKGDCLMPCFTSQGRCRTFCSGEWKRDVITRFMMKCGIGRKLPVREALGFSAEEAKRVKKDKAKYRHNVFPLIELGLTAEDCQKIVEAAGLPRPRRSSCWCCPNRVNSEWQYLKDQYPADFESACMVDADVRGRSKNKGEFLFLHRSCKPLAQCSFANKGDSCGSKDCESGRCFV